MRVELSIVGQWIQANNRLLDQATVTCEKKILVREVNVEVVLSSCTMVVTRLADKS